MKCVGAENPQCLTERHGGRSERGRIVRRPNIRDEVIEVFELVERFLAEYHPTGAY
ncbi:MAG: hypothetical protein JWQ43_3512 [Glaciihabitans sp.]|nr:hypothetical protein [Glaciihabitans sp.]